MNILTFDIEEWALARDGGYGSPEKYAEYDALLDRILNLLDQTGTKATFFCTGQMAEFFPAVVRKIQSRGHEIGCHSYCHTWMNKMDYKTAEDDTRRAVDAIEQCIGEKVLCYRAPAFSIGESNKWMFEILASCGITCDASIFPAKRDFGGFQDFQCYRPCILEYTGIQIKEFPICLTSIFGRTIAYSGGGYFRLFPYYYINSLISNSNYSICYFHIDDILSSYNPLKSRKEYEQYFHESGSLKNRYSRFIKSNIGKARAWDKMKHLITDIKFQRICDSVGDIDWKSAPYVII